MFPYVASIYHTDFTDICGSCFEIFINDKSIFVTTNDWMNPDASGFGGVSFGIEKDLFKETFGNDDFDKGYTISDYREVDPCKCRSNQNCKKNSLFSNFEEGF